LTASFDEDTSKVSTNWQRVEWKSV